MGFPHLRGNGARTVEEPELVAQTMSVDPSIHGLFRHAIIGEDPVTKQPIIIGEHVTPFLYPVEDHFAKKNEETGRIERETRKVLACPIIDPGKILPCLYAFKNFRFREDTQTWIVGEREDNGTIAWFQVPKVGLKTDLTSMKMAETSSP